LLLEKVFDAKVPVPQRSGQNAADNVTVLAKKRKKEKKKINDEEFQLTRTGLKY
jgi:hypothetical protein